MLKKTLILFLVFLVSIFLSSAITEYTEVGGVNGYFNAGNMLFNDDYSASFGIPLPYSRFLSYNANKHMPLIDDFDNDGVTEVAFLDGTTLKMYQGKMLTLVTTETVLGTEGLFSSLYSFDIDNDNNNEIMFWSAAKMNLSIYSFNGSAFLLENRIDFKGKNIVGTDADMMIKCADTDLCVAVYNNRHDNSGGATDQDITIATFDRNDVLGYELIYTRNTFYPMCLPRIPDIQYADYDMDGNTEMIFSFYDQGAATGSEVDLVYAYLNTSGSYSVEKDIRMSGSGITSSCDVLGNYVSSPLVFDAQTGGGLETIIAHAVDSNEFKIYVYDKNSNIVDDHPEASEADGVIISNPIKMNAFPVDKTGLSDLQNDYCVLGFSQTDQYIDLICGSILNNFQLMDTIEFFSLYSGYNISLDTFDFMPTVFTVNAKANNFDGENTDEIITTYGTFQLTDDNCPSELPFFCGTCAIGVNKCLLDSLYVNGAGGIVLPIDLENVDYDDYISVTSSNIIYMDDKFTNNPPVICGVTRYCTVNPSNPIQLNSTIGVTVKGTDPDNDLVSYRVIFYYGDTNQYYDNEGAWSSNISGGLPVQFFGVANKTITNGKIRLEMRDNFAPSTNIDFFDYDMIVQNNGFVYGESIQEIGGTETEAETDTGSGNATSSVITVTSSENAVSKSVNTFAGIFGFSSMLVWLVLMVVAGFVTIQTSKKEFNFHNTEAITMLVAVELLMLILGVFLGFFGVGIIITLVVLSLLIAAVYLRKIFTGSSN